MVMQIPETPALAQPRDEVKKRTHSTKQVRQPSRPKETPEEFARRLHETRVEFVADMLREGRFLTYRTAAALEREWTLSNSEVAQIVKQARRRVRRELTDPEFVASVVKAVALWAEIAAAVSSAEGTNTDDTP